jgi:multisubunit Na+/H+ antiporter MnhG subunit
MKVKAGPPAGPADRTGAKALQGLTADELNRIRSGAVAWRNGLGALLAGLLGFSLIKGRSDVSQLRPGYAIAVGALLLAALITGAVAAVLVMRAAHGRPSSVDLRDDVPDPAAAAREIEADRSERALGRGVRLVFGCVALLIAAVAVTWYGPEKDKPRIDVQLTDNSRWCGEVISIQAGRLTLKTARGQVLVNLTEATTIAATNACPS